DRYRERVHFKRVIPCLDVDAGRVVKGVEFVDIRDAGDPVTLAAVYDRGGADELVFLDITATHEKRDTIVELARRTRFGAQCIVLAIDAKARADGGGWNAHVRGGRTGTDRDTVAWAREGVERGAGEILLTSMD